MSETPKCPYCGAEMKVDTVRITQHNWVGWYHCENCRSVGPSKSNCYTEKEAEESAISAALHRAEPEMRPLTLEEVEAHCEDGIGATPLWVEFKIVPDVSRWMCAELPGHVFSLETIKIFLRSCGERYGKTCRCWPRKPTPEQMAAAEWEE